MIKLKKVIDVHDLPQILKEEVFDKYSGELSNGSYIEYTWDADFLPELTSWLLKQGVKEGEEIILLYWW